MKRSSEAGVSRAAVLVAGACVMVPWPLLALLVTTDLRDGPDEALLLVGGITSIPLLVIHATPAEDPDLLFRSGVIAVWIAALVLPAALPARARRSRRKVTWQASLQSLFAFSQAAFGVLLLLGKGV